MSKRINCSVSGKATDTPYLTIDNGHILHGQFENPQRVRFFVDDGEPTDGASWGFTIFAGGKAYRTAECSLPEAPNSDKEGPLLQYAPALARLIPEYTRFQNDVWAMMTGFCDYQFWMTGRRAELRAAWTQARDFGCRGRRVLGMMGYITDFAPQMFSMGYYGELAPFAADAAEYGQRIHFDVFADAQVVMPNRDQQLAHWARTCDALRPLESVVIGAGNEYQKNGFDPFALPYPGVLSSQGSSLSDTAPPMPGWGVRMWHGRRGPYPKQFNGADDMVYVGLGYDANNGQYAPFGAVVHDEPMGAAEVDIPGRRSTDPQLFRSLMLTGKAYGGGATFHSEDGIFSRLLGRQQSVCARAFFDAQ